MKTSHPKLRLAFLLSLPLEVINFWVIGYPPGPHPIIEAAHHPAVALQWYLLHIPGILIGDRNVYIREHHAIESVVFFLAGLLDTALLLLLLFWILRLARGSLRRLSSPHRQVA